MTPAELIGTILLSGTFGAIVKEVVQSLLNRRRLGADADKIDAEAEKAVAEGADVVTKAALALVEPLSRRIHELDNEVETLRAKVRETTQELETCRVQGRAKDRRIRELEHTRPAQST